MKAVIGWTSSPQANCLTPNFGTRASSLSRDSLPYEVVPSFARDTRSRGTAPSSELTAMVSAS